MAFQFPRREDDDLGPPPPPFQFRRRGFEFRSFGGYNKYIFLAVALLLAYVVLSTLKGIYVDWLWFDSAGYRSVFSKMIQAQALLFAGGALLFLAFFTSNTLLAARPLLRAPVSSVSDEEAAMLRRVYWLAIIALALFFAVIFGTIAAGRWDTILSFLEGADFGVTDPQFDRDIGFYVFELPALRFFYGWLMGMAVLTVVAAASLYLLRFLTYGPEDSTAKQGRWHLSILLVIVVALFVWRYWLNQFELNFSDTGAVFGATYTDIHARLPILYVGMALASLTGVALIATAAGRSIMLPIGAAAVWAIVMVVVGGLYPLGVQRFTVEPSELQRERPYIERNIELTRTAFGLHEIDERAFPAENRVTREEIANHPETINNIRLLDVRPLLATYRQIQLIRPLYLFNDVDIDRYIIDGERRQVMVAARELSGGQLPADAQSWVNQRLQFTHGYGAVMSPVNEVVGEGLPALFLRDIPVTGELEVDQPGIYYGEEPDRYVVVKTTDEEFDYPIGNGSASTVFEGDSGVHIGSLLNRLVFAWEFADINILISGSLTDESRILFRRNIQARIDTVAPFLTLDQDPYLIVSEGRLFWMQDAYTTTDRYPYSQPSAAGYNYIRNSVKVIIDAYTGDMTFYLIDDEDPIIQTWANIFPELFTPFDEMPESLQAHIRYPVDLFNAQVDKYLLYHLTDPVARYNQEDIWTVPTEVVETDQDVPVDPYYVIMRIPGEPQEEFVLILPLTPANRQNTIAWVAARSDGEHYGKLLAFQFPTNTLVFGPRQVEVRIDQDPVIAQQFALWRQSASDVIRGNLLMIPIGDGNLFVEPIYLQGQSSELPELKRVIVVNGNEIAMEPTLERSLEVVLGEAEPTAPTLDDLPGGAQPPAQPTAPADGAEPTATPEIEVPTLTPTPTEPLPTPTSLATAIPPPAPTPGDLPDNAAELAAEANAAFERAQAALAAGDFATYGEEIARVEALVQELAELTAGQ